MAASSIEKMFIFSLAKTRITVQWFCDGQELVQYLGDVHQHWCGAGSTQILVHCSSS
jgi:hypothetical protein